MILDIVVDVQKDFITGALANPQAQANVTRLAETVKAHARAGHWLFLTRDTHPDIIAKNDRYIIFKCRFRTCNYSLKHNISVKLFNFSCVSN